MILNIDEQSDFYVEIYRKSVPSCLPKTDIKFFKKLINLY